MKLETPIQRLKALYRMMAGIPEPSVMLASYFTGSEDSERPQELPQAVAKDPDCGSTGCLLGWAAVYPPFNELGLKFENGTITYGDCSGDKWAGERFFGIHTNVAGGERIFAARGAEERGGALTPLSDHQIALRRVRRYLLELGAITAERNAELAKAEGSVA